MAERYVMPDEQPTARYEGLIDPPGPFAPVEEQRRFLASMRELYARCPDPFVALHIAEAEQWLAEELTRDG